MDLHEEEIVNTTTLEPQVEVKTETETELNTFLDLDEFIKSEKEIKKAPELKGLTSVEKSTLGENKTFKKKSEQKQGLLKKRFKIVSAVYIAIASLMLTFVGVNIATMVSLNKQITSNTATIQAESKAVSIYENANTPIETPTDQIFVSLNEPRDYSDDVKELTFLDKLTILIRNIFG